LLCYLIWQITYFPYVLILFRQKSADKTQMKKDKQTATINKTVRPTTEKQFCLTLKNRWSNNFVQTATCYWTTLSIRNLQWPIVKRLKMCIVFWRISELRRVIIRWRCCPAGFQQQVKSVNRDACAYF